MENYKNRYMHEESLLTHAYICGKTYIYIYIYAYIISDKCYTLEVQMKTIWTAPKIIHEIIISYIIMSSFLSDSCHTNYSRGSPCSQCPPNTICKDGLCSKLHMHI